MSKTVMITGASHGIGRECAIQFAKEGYRLILNCRQSTDTLEDLATYLRDTYQTSCLVCIGDIGCKEDVRNIFHHAILTYGGIDILINNAGISHVGLLHDMTDEEWHRIFQTNVDSIFYCCREAIPYMLNQQSGRIINISSVWGNIGASMEVAYSATKGAVNSFTKALAKELAPSNIPVNALACGTIDTRMNACFSDEERKALEEEIPAGRYGTTKEAAEVILSLATAPSYLTGQIITLDGGWT